MDIFGVLTMLGGLAMFLYGMNAMGDGLSKVSGGKMEQILEKLTSNKLKGVLLGALVTAVIQSSSATTVMVVGFVNSGIMKLSQAISIIMGSNIGTTMTAWILSLSGVEGDSFFIKMLKPTSFSPVLAIIGIALILFAKSEKKKDVGNILVGFAILMFGMDTMSGAVKPLANVPEFTSLFTMFTNPILGVLVGALVTAIIQSSSASVGILQALCATGAITYGVAFPIILGQNIGTCVTAMISSIGANKGARRTALVHLYFNIVGTVIFMLLFVIAKATMNPAILGETIDAAGIAVIHSLFNIGATLILLPFSKGLEKMAYLTVKDEPEDSKDVRDEALRALDIRFLDQPGYAMTLCRAATIRMAELVKEAIQDSIGLLENYDEEKAAHIEELENKIDLFEDEIGIYLMKISAKDVSEQDSKTLSLLLHSIGDFERISDHALNVCESAKEKYEKGLEFSETAKKEVEIFSGAIKDIVSLAVDTFVNEDLQAARDVEPLEDVVDKLNVKMKRRHVERLRQGTCTIELGFILSDITTNYERIADHCSNIAVSVLQKEDEFDSHEYLDTLEKGENTAFRKKYLEYKEKYRLP